MRHLYYGDNLDVMKRHIKDESVDLIYLDPPFKSNRDYNVLFKEKDGTEAASQIMAFTDTWSWGQDDALLYGNLIVDPALPERLRNTLKAMFALLCPAGIGTDMMSYIVMMAPRLVEMRRTMKPTASIYLHCDPTASHYLKMLMDAVFGPANFRTEIVWKRSSAHSDAKQGRSQHGRIHDVILFYTKTDEWSWKHIFTPYDESYTDAFYKHIEPETGRRYRLGDLTGPGGAAKGNPSYEVMGVTRFWRYSKEKMEELIRQGRIVQTKQGTVPAYKRYLDEMPGVPLQDWWGDIGPIAAQAAERLGYPTQKPLVLLERIISSSCPEGGVVLDPFCGCGTAIHAAEKLGRKWIGIDITHLSIGLMKGRLLGAFGLIPLTKEGKHADADKTYRITGEPTTLAEALQLKEDGDGHQFEYWALGLVGARPVEEKKGADKGIDGKLFFVGDNPKELETIIISVKSGHVERKIMHELGGVVEREKAVIGVLITMKPPTRDMNEEVLAGGFYESTVWGKKYPRLQILSIEEIMGGAGIAMPPINQVNATFIKAHKEPAAQTHSQGILI